MIQDIFSEYQSFIFLAIGLIALAVSFFLKDKKSKLKETGIPVDGIVFEQNVDNSDNQSYDNSFSSIKDKITVRFVTQDQEWVTGVIKQGFHLFYTGQYKNGETVKVYYDKDNPSTFYVETKQSELVGRLFIGLIGLIFCLIGLYKLFMQEGSA